MTPRHSLICVAIVFTSVSAAFADPPSTIYVTNGTGRQVLAVNTQTGSAQALVTASSPLADVTQKADGGVYYATATDIRRVGQAAVVAPVSGAQELRFSAYNRLYYNSAAGLLGSDCSPSTPDTGGRGLAFTMFGDLLAICGSTVIRVPLNPQGDAGTPTVIASSGLTSPTSIAVAAGKAGGLERGDFVVTDGRFVRLFNKNGGIPVAYASVPAGQTINFADFDAEDTLWLAAQASSTGTNDPNGRVYKVAAGGGTPVLVATLPKLQGKYYPAVGVAPGPSSRVLTRSVLPGVPNLSQAFEFDFGGSIVEIHGVVHSACELRVRSSVVLEQTATTLVNNNGYSLNPYLGDEGLATVYRIQSFQGANEVDASACVQVTPDTKPFVYIAALPRSEISPRILRCEGSCGELELFGWWHTGPIDGDAEGGGRGDDWSDWIIVEKNVAPAPDEIRFCGVGPPLNAAGTATFNTGSNLTVRVQFSAPGYTCESGVFLTDQNARFLISVARVSPVHEKKRLIASSGNSGTPPTLGLNGKWYDFELSLKDSGVDWEPGRYEITLTDVTPGGARLRGTVQLYYTLGKS